MLMKFLHVIRTLKVKSDHRSKFSNLSNIGKMKPENVRTSMGFELLDAGAMLDQLSHEGTQWERGQLVEFISSREVK